MESATNIPVGTSGTWNLSTAFTGQIKQDWSENLNTIVDGVRSYDLCCRRFTAGSSLDAYLCGSCGSYYPSMCKLHEHIETHGLGGSFQYDHKSKTAIPKIDSVCNASQTDSKVLTVVNIEADSCDHSEKLFETIQMKKYKEHIDMLKEQFQPTEKERIWFHSYALVDRCTFFTLEQEISKRDSVYPLEYEITSQSGRSTVANENHQDTSVCQTTKDTSLGISRQNNDQVVIEMSVVRELQSKNKTKMNTENEEFSMDSPSLIQLDEYEQTNIKLSENEVKADNHTEVESTDLKYACLDCKLIFNTERHLHRHMQKHQGNNLCDCCHKCFSNLAEFEKHVLDGEGKTLMATEILSCSYCGIMITDLKGLKAHLCESEVDKTQNRLAVRIHTGTSNRRKVSAKVLQYVHCRKNELALNRHNKVQCNTCHQQFEDDYFFILHQIIHVYIYKCSSCDLHFTSADSRDQHGTTCNGSQPAWTCSTCSRKFHSESSLITHKETHKIEAQCDMCGAVFKGRRNLKDHKKRCPTLENRERPYQCEVCEKRFYQRTNLRKHMNTLHSDVRHFVCEICGATFKTNQVLKRHSEVHLQSRDYTCDICGAVFKLSLSFKRHRKTHLQQSKETCLYCGKTFHARWNLKAHLRQHTGEKPYKCDLCGQGFTHNVSRKAHMRKCQSMT